MKKITLLMFAACACLRMHAQMAQPSPTVFICTEGTAYPMKAATSQVEIKNKWKVQGIDIKRNPVRYFGGAHAGQTAGRLPRFAIYPTTQKLNDYVLVRLKSKKNHRRLPAADVKDCPYTRIDLNEFRIENLPDMGFAVTPLEPLSEGEYILTDITQESVNQYGDFKAYDFSVGKE